MHYMQTFVTYTCTTVQHYQVYNINLLLTLLKMCTFKYVFMTTACGDVALDYMILRGFSYYLPF